MVYLGNKNCFEPMWRLSKYRNDKESALRSRFLKVKWCVAIVEVHILHAVSLLQEVLELQSSCFKQDEAFASPLCATPAPLLVKMLPHSCYPPPLTGYVPPPKCCPAWILPSPTHTHVSPSCIVSPPLNVAQQLAT